MNQVGRSGKVVGRLGRFALEAELGHGAMGVVYRATHPGLGVPVAIKVLAEAFSRDESFRERFQREAATVASLNHPGIVRVYDFDSDDGSLFIVMEFVEGHSLRHWLNTHGRFTVEVAIDLVQQMLSAVSAAHARGIVHRDLKPDNVLVTKQGKTKILDFGISKVLGDGRHLTATGAVVGTPAYMATEQVRGDDVDQRADVYAMGVIAYELMHGAPPFSGPLPQVLHAHAFEQVRPSTAIPPHVFAVIERAMAKDRDARYQTCEEFSGALMQVLRPDAARTETPPAQAPPPQPPRGLRALLRSVTQGGARRPVEVDPDLPGGCAQGVCEATEGWPCAYEDAKGQRCDTWWCRKHVVFIDAVPFCPRHASVVRALQATAGTIREIKHRPDVGDRALPLAAKVAADVDKDLSEIIRTRYGARPGIRLARDQTIRQTWERRGVPAWERSWAALRDQGYVARVGIRVSADEPDIVKVSVGQATVLAEVPDWISRRRGGGAPDPADEARFRNRVVDAVIRQLDQPTPAPATARPAEPAVATPTPMVDRKLLDGLVLRTLAAVPRLTAYELGERLALPYAAIGPCLDGLSSARLVEPLGIDPSREVAGRPLPERMAYSVSTQGRAQIEDLPGTRYLGPAPVSLAEFADACAGARSAAQVDTVGVARVLEGIELAPGVVDAVRAAVATRSSLFLYGPAGNGKTSLARRVAALLGGPVLVPYAIDCAGDVLRVFDPAVHRLAHGPQPADRRWRRVERPLVQVGGEFMLDQLEPAYDRAARTYEAPLQVKAAGGVLLLDDLGRQRAPAREILDRLLVPLEQGIDFMALAASGRKIEFPFACQLVISTNMTPADLLDEAYLRRLRFKILMPDPSWESWGRIFDSECERLGIPLEPRALDLLRSLYGGRPARGSHPRDLLERVAAIAAARGQRAVLTPEVVESAWRTLFVTA